MCQKEFISVAAMNVGGNWFNGPSTTTTTITQNDTENSTDFMVWDSCKNAKNVSFLSCKIAPYIN